MFIEKLEISDYRMISQLELNFKYPQSPKNIVNVIIGRNGCGKTQIIRQIRERLHFILTASDKVKASFRTCFKDSYQSSPISLDYTKVNMLIPFRKHKSDSEENNYYTVVYIPSKVFFQNIKLENNTPQRIVNHKNGEARIKPGFLVEEAKKNINELQVSNLCLKSHTLEENSIDETLRQLENFINKIRHNLSISDPQERQQEAIRQVNEKYAALELDTIIVEVKNNQIKFANRYDLTQRLRFEELSSGEQQLYTKFTALITIDPQHSVILIDEPELSLHPEWQNKFVKMLKTIGKCNQFILATHSPYIINNLSADDSLIILDKVKGKIYAHSDYKQIERDINVVLRTVMGLSSTVPEEVLQLREKYRNLVEQRLEENDEGLATLQELLKLESAESSFLQEMNLIRLLRV